MSKCEFCIDCAPSRCRLCQLDSAKRAGAREALLHALSKLELRKARERDLGPDERIGDGSVEALQVAIECISHVAAGYAEPDAT